MKDLAIIIPAYKADFLDKALSSLASQTNKNFNVYIGDDCSPYDIKSIVDKYIEKLNITYKRFDSNMGGKDLVSQWERCIHMSKDEKWIWLFSDDDEMEENCVGLFYNAIENTRYAYDLYHFDVIKINEESKVIDVPPAYPDIFNSYDFYCEKMKGNILSFVVENVFSRSIWEKTGGFQNFDLAWGSDTASWVKFMQNTGMFTIHGAHVRWRSSGQNISPNFSSIVVERKMNALIEYYRWSYSYFESLGIEVKKINIQTYIRRVCTFKKYVSLEFMKRCNHTFCEIQNIEWMEWLLNFYTRLR